MAADLTRWFLRISAQWICAALLALAITAVEHHYVWVPGAAAHATSPSLAQ